MKDTDRTKQASRRLIKEEIKKQLIDSIVYNKNINTEDLNEWGNRVEDYEEAMGIIKEYEDIIKTNKRNTIFFADQQGKGFTRFKQSRRFKSLFKRFKISKGTIIFKKNIVKLVDKYPKMITSWITLNFLKSY